MQTARSKCLNLQVIHGYGGLERYCPQLAQPKFWGGEVEMMIIARSLRVPIHVYRPVAELDIDLEGTPSSQRCAPNGSSPEVQFCGGRLPCGGAQCTSDCALRGSCWQGQPPAWGPRAGG